MKKTSQERAIRSSVQITPPMITMETKLITKKKDMSSKIKLMGSINPGLGRLSSQTIRSTLLLTSRTHTRRDLTHNRPMLPTLSRQLQNLMKSSGLISTSQTLHPRQRKMHRKTTMRYLKLIGATTLLSPKMMPQRKQPPLHRVLQSALVQMMCLTWTRSKVSQPTYRFCISLLTIKQTANAPESSIARANKTNPPILLFGSMFEYRSEPRDQSTSSNRAQPTLQVMATKTRAKAMRLGKDPQVRCPYQRQRSKPTLWGLDGKNPGFFSN